MKLKEQVDLIADYLEKVLQAHGWPPGETITIDTATLCNITEILRNIAENLDHVELNEIQVQHYRDHLEKLVKIGKMVRAESGKKDKAYRRAAKEMGWTAGKKTPDFDLVVEYLSLIGVFCTERGETSPELSTLYRSLYGEQTPMDRIEAIELLAAKYPDPKRGKSNKNPRTNIYSRIQDAKKALIAALKADGRPYKHLDRILPYDEEIRRRDDEARDAYRYEDPEYDE